MIGQEQRRGSSVCRVPFFRVYYPLIARRRGLCCGSEAMLRLDGNKTVPKSGYRHLTTSVRLAWHESHQELHALAQ